MQHEIADADVTVIGGGLAGVCAAIAAARRGRTVSLINNRPVLGGNSSSEVRVWVVGATAHGVHNFAREGGIMGELFVENQFRNPEGNPYYWDLVVLDAVRSEPNITLFLNTDVREVDASGPEGERTIDSVTGWMMGSERSIRFNSPIYLDCTGDGLIGFLAGAKFSLGREARSTYGEAWAPEVADDITLGSTMLFYTKDTGIPSTFVPPSFAKDIKKTPIPEHRIIKAGDNGCAYWWIEWGGELDTVTQNERIRDELWAVIYGIWDHIKNSGEFDADTMALEWVGSVPGKREYRRFVGDYVLTEADILGQTEFQDRVAFGGWSIDLHPPQGMYATESGSKHLFSDGVYHIPFRSLYSVNCGNMLMAGRNISASHVAFGSTRVMATCGTLGEAAGAAAALCVEREVGPRRLAEMHSEDLVNSILRYDGSIVGAAMRDPLDLAPQARVSASSTLRQIALEPAGDTVALDTDIAVVLPLSSRVDTIDVLLQSDATVDVTAEICLSLRGENFVPERPVASDTQSVTGGVAQWVCFQLPCDLGNAADATGNIMLVLRAANGVSAHLADITIPGVIVLKRTSLVGPDGQPQPALEWSPKQLHRRALAVRVANETTALAPERVTDGIQRQFCGPHMWSSGPLADDAEPWLELAWNAPVEVGRVELIFDDDVNEDLINLHYMRTPGREMPTLVRDYVVETRSPGNHAWTAQAEERENRRRFRTHDFDERVQTDAIRLRIRETNGSPTARVIAVRAYGKS